MHTSPSSQIQAHTHTHTITRMAQYLLDFTSFPFESLTLTLDSLWLSVHTTQIMNTKTMSFQCVIPII